MMLLGGDRKKIVSIIVGNAQPSYVGKEGGEMEGEYKTPDSDTSEAKLDGANELISAVKGGDAEAVVKAFENMMTLCSCADEPTFDEAM